MTCSCKKSLTHFSPMNANASMRVGGVDGGECDAPVKITTPGAVDDFKSRVHTFMVATNLSVDNCKGFSIEDWQAWKLFYSQWTTFKSKPTPTFGSYQDWITTCGYSKSLDAWREKISTKCVLAGPDKIKGYGESGGIDALKWGFAATAVIGTLAVLAIYSPEIKAGVGSLFGGKKVRS